MITTTDRLATLVETLERGGEIDGDDLRRVAQLQTLDVGTLGREYVIEAIRTQETADDGIA